ncbi:hypothetical protein K491DRAFT_678072 [Lophiostoma macrostomum CBS 122681]|uniref:Mid2 domain-containing protein n=1 Tax=Lophiostoma macrostomum CBS 122681 TaxID=1314788 RepID=A0A6A6T9I2_9PLEO|nr:hypothetical protein K491DRAFT_678072 [Lophiostoma macrostomum CBS 122681]
MGRILLLSVTAVYLHLVLAAYDAFFFSSDSTQWQCPELPYSCPPPAACAHDGVTDKSYCCVPGKDSICWTETTPTTSPAQAKSGATAAPQHSAASPTGELNSTHPQNPQKHETRNANLRDTREECTARTDQYNICWATQPNILQNLTKKQMNNTYSSISSARPSQTYYTFNANRLVSSATATATDTDTASLSSSATSATTGPTSTSSQATSSASGLSSGAIAGIVIGAIAGLALIGAGAFLLWRRSKSNNKTTHGNELDPSSNPYVGNATHPTGPVTGEKYAGYDGQGHNGGVHEAPPFNTAPVEMGAGSRRQEPVEVEGSVPEGGRT